MNELIFRIINLDTSSLTLIFSGIVAVSTIFYALLTCILVFETNKMRKVQTEPNVSVFIQPKEEFNYIIDMFIQNIGLGPARDIIFEVQPDFEYISGQFLSEVTLIKNGINYLAPNQKIRIFSTSLLEDLALKTKEPINIEIVYTNSVGNNYKSIYQINFSEMVGLSQIGAQSTPLFRLAKSIKEIQSDLKEISIGLKQFTEYSINNKEEINENK